MSVRTTPAPVGGHLRSAFPVLQRTAYLNAGTFGPLPAASARAAAEIAARDLAGGRLAREEAAREAVRERLRAGYARALGDGVDPHDVAVTTGTTAGVAGILSALMLRAGDEVVTSDAEHPGLLGSLAALRRRGVVVRTAPLERIHDAVGPRTRLVACSHVSWLDGRLAPRELRDVGRELPVLLDGAQGAGAVPVDPVALGCAFYAAAGQKWLCGPVGTGLLWVAPAWRERLAPEGLGWLDLADPDAGLDAAAWPDARAFDNPAPPAPAIAAAVAALDVLSAGGWAAIHRRSAALAASFAQALRERGLAVAPRDATTLVSFDAPGGDAVATVARLAAAGVDARGLPGATRVRVSVGAWNDERDLERLLAAL